MKLNRYFMNWLTKSTVLVLLVSFSLFFGQATSKFDRVFKELYENRVSFKTGKSSIKDLPIPNSIENKAVKSAQVYYNCIIYTKDAQLLKNKGILVQSVLPTFVTALVTIDDLETLNNLKEVIRVKAPEYSEGNNEIGVAQSGASLLHSGALNNTAYTGKDVLVGVFDSGIDFKHPDFRDAQDNKKSRILRMWDQTITPQGTESNPANFNYGVEYTQAQINDEINGVTKDFVREKDLGGHGTHVAGTAAGNGKALSTGIYKGMAPEANYIIVKGGNGSFPSSNTINALTYFNRVANELNKPIVVNMSIGGHFSPHDGTGDKETAVDTFSNSANGRVVVISAGNDNGNNIHNQMRIPAGQSSSFNVNVSSNTTSRFLFGVILYSNSRSDFTVDIISPTGERVPIAPNASVRTDVMEAKFKVYGDNLIDQSNNNRYLDLFLGRNPSDKPVDAQGNWTVLVTNNSGNTITTDAWRYYQDRDVDYTITIENGDNNMLVGSPGTSRTAITVASYAANLSWRNLVNNSSYNWTNVNKKIDDISTYSSRGPLRDGTQKPDIAATGETIVSALSEGSLPANSPLHVDGKYYRVMSGTSMSAPMVTGAVALLLQAKPDATFRDIKRVITENAVTDNATVAPPNYSFGYGKLDVFQAASALLNNRLSRRTYINETYPYALSTDDAKSVISNRLAQSYTPDIDGYLGGVYFHVSRSFDCTGFTVEIRENNAGVPGNLISSKSIDPKSIALSAWNYINLYDLNVKVTKGTSYFVVLYSSGISLNWTIRFQSSNTNNVAQVSADNGTTWIADTNLPRVRTVVYENPNALGVKTPTSSKKIMMFYSNDYKRLYVKLPSVQASTYKVYDMSGKLVKTMNGQSDNVEIDIQNLAPGSYILNIVTATETINNKFLKK